MNKRDVRTFHAVFVPDISFLIVSYHLVVVNTEHFLKVLHEPDARNYHNSDIMQKLYRSVLVIK